MAANPLKHSWLIPDWPTIDGVHALFTTREGGYSQAPWDSMNLGNHVGDDPQCVARNRALLSHTMAAQSGRPIYTVFLQQVHGTQVQSLHAQSSAELVGDACLTTHSGVACTMMVADCLPVLWAHRSGAVVAASHAGWRGLVGQQGQGVLHSTMDAIVQAVQSQGVACGAQDLQVWLGPCIGPQAFEVGDEVRQAFVSAHADNARAFEFAAAAGKWMADLPLLARMTLHRMGITAIYGNDGSAPWCTVSQPSVFFSHRRDAARLGTTGRMAASIWRV